MSVQSKHGENQMKKPLTATKRKFKTTQNNIEVEQVVEEAPEVDYDLKGFLIYKEFLQLKQEICKNKTQGLVEEFTRDVQSIFDLFNSIDALSQEVLNTGLFLAFDKFYVEMENYVFMFSNNLSISDVLDGLDDNV